MSDQLTPPGPALPQPTTPPASPTPGSSAPAAVDEEQPDGRRTSWVWVPVQMVAVLAVFAGAGALCGWLWFKVWTPPPGAVFAHQWFPDPVEAGLRAEFSGTGLYVVIAVLGGLVVGAVTAYFFGRSEIATLVAVVVGSALAGWLMLRVGMELSPLNPEVLAKAAEDGTKLSGHLYVADASDPDALVLRPALLCFPAGALVGLAVVYLVTGSRRGTTG